MASLVHVSKKESSGLPAQALGDGSGQGGTRGTEKKQALTNPFGANQYKLDPRQALLLAYLLDPKSQTFGNYRGSAILAGYEENYADQMSADPPAWLVGRVRNTQQFRMLEKAERNLNEMLDLPSEVQAMGAYGPVFEKKRVKQKKTLKNGKKKEVFVIKKVPVMIPATGLLKIKNDVSQFVAERIGREVYGKEAESTPPTGSITQMVQITINPPKV